jgi:hypothetical protein
LSSLVPEAHRADQYFLETPGVADQNACGALLLLDLEEWVEARDTYCGTMLALQTGFISGAWSATETSPISSWHQDHREICVEETNSRMALEASLLDAARTQVMEIFLAAERSERSAIISGQEAWRLEEAVGLMRQGDGRTDARWTGPGNIDIDILCLMESYKRNTGDLKGLRFPPFLAECIRAVCAGQGKKPGYSFCATRTETGWSSAVDINCGRGTFGHAAGLLDEDGRYTVRTHIPKPDHGKDQKGSRAGNR